MSGQNRDVFFDESRFGDLIDKILERTLYK